MLSTNRMIFQSIFDMYSEAFKAAQKIPDNDLLGGRIYLPIDIVALAKKLNEDPHLIFGRLYYHLDAKHRYKTNDKTSVHLFTLGLGTSKHCINYPYLAALLAEEDESHATHQRTFWVSIAALVFSLGSIAAQIISIQPIK